jgi:lipoprotein NlpD
MISFERSYLPKYLLALGLAFLAAGCMTRPAAPVVERAPVPSTRTALPSAEAPTRGAAEAAQAPTYIVKRGDTLYQIALDHGLDYRELAAWNNIDNLNVIRVGQVLVLAAPGGAAAASTEGGVVTAPLVSVPPVAPSSSGEARPAPAALPSGRANSATYKTEPRALKLPYSEHALAQLRESSPASVAAAEPRPATPESRATPAPTPTTPAPTAAAPNIAAPSTSTANASAPPLPARPEAGRVPEIDDDGLAWMWPTTGKIIAGFSESANLKGIDIAGKAGQPIVASAAGKVVYVGSGLRGYGKLVIVKHNTTFLSAYAHNREVVVKEGQQVTKGQKIAEMGDTDSDQVKLHFEIRRLGKPVDPVKFLPPV